MAARVLIVDAKPHRSQELERALREAGFEVLMAVDGQDDLHARVQALAPDAIIVDTDLPSRDTLEGLAYLGKKYPKPMIMLAHDTDPSLTVAAARAASPPTPWRKYPRRRCARWWMSPSPIFPPTRRCAPNWPRPRTPGKPQVGGPREMQLMERKGIGEEAAYQYLRKTAMDRRMSLTDLARELWIRITGNDPWPTP